MDLSEASEVDRLLLEAGEVDILVANAAKAVIGAIEHNRGEVNVAPITLRLGSAFAGIAPELSATITRKSGSDKIAYDLADGHRAKQKLQDGFRYVRKAPTESFASS